MKKNPKLRKSFSDFSRKKQPVEDIYYGELGIPLGGSQVVDVPGRKGFVYVRLHGNTSELIQAFNQSVPPIFDLAVIVKRVRSSYSIVGRDNAKYANLGSGAGGGVIPLPRHGGQHSFNPEAGMGADVAWIYSRQFMHNLMYPSGTSLELALSPAFYEWNGQWKYINPTGSVNMQPHIPTVTGSARMALVWVDGGTGDIRISAGSLFSGAITNPWDIAGYIPDIDRNTGMPLMAVKLTTGTSSLDWSNLYDVRDFLTVQKRFNGIAIQDSGTPKGTGTTLNFGNNLTVSMAGSVTTIDATGGGGSGSSPYFRVAQPTPITSTTGTSWKVPEPYATGSIAVFNQGHALIIGIDYTEQYPASGTYQYAEAQPTGTYHLALYGAL